MFISFFGAQMGLIATDAKAAGEAADALFSRLDHASERDPFDPSGEKPAAVAGDLAVEDVVFAYPTAPSHRVCNGYSLSVPAGSTCALVGPSGSGKSTVVSLIERFYDPESGVVRLDGVDIKTLNLRWLRAQFGLVSQEPVLFTGTVAENISYGKPGCSREEIEEAARMANAHSFVMEVLAQGYETQVGLGGGKLSGGRDPARFELPISWYNPPLAGD